MPSNGNSGGDDPKAAPSALATWRARRLAKQARAWLVRLDSGEGDPRNDQVRDRAFARWLEKPGAEAAFLRAASLWSEIDEAVLAEKVASARVLRWTPRPPRTARKWTLALTLAASFAALAFVGPGLWIALSADVRTGAFETRTIALEDGSSVILASHSAADIEYRAAERRIRLLEGEASFNVAPDRARPFIVTAGGGETRALGTRFLVAWRDGGVTVTGVEHRIQASVGAAARELGPGEAVYYRRFAAPDAVPADRYAGAWQNGIVLFENRPLFEIADEMERYSDRPIWVLGGARERAFSGTFRIADPVAGLRAAASTARLRVTEFPGLVVVTAR